MSCELISRSPDLLKLQAEGYEIEVRGGHLLVHSVPYVNAERKTAVGTLITPLTLAGEVTTKPDNHVVYFCGAHPCNKDGTEISGIKHGSNTQHFGNDIEVYHSFSNKPPQGYADYHQKMTRYVEIISAPAQSIDPSLTAQTFRPVVSSKEESVFRYRESASARAGISGLVSKLAVSKVAIVGLGGTGSYILDLIAKTPVQEIHLFDGDRFFQHNAFRTPGAASLEELKSQPYKVRYLLSIYEKMRYGLIGHECYITEENVDELAKFDFVFICVDMPMVRKLISDTLQAHQVPFIDVGMGIELLNEEQVLYGSCRVTLSTPQKWNHVPQRIPFVDGGNDDLYPSNIQIADLNALNATLAVIKWKKHLGFYQDLVREHDSVYAINAHQLTKDERL